MPPSAHYYYYLPLRHLSLLEPFALLRFYTLSIKYPL